MLRVHPRGSPRAFATATTALVAPLAPGPLLLMAGVAAAAPRDAPGEEDCGAMMFIVESDTTFPPPATESSSLFPVTVFG